MSVTMKKYIPLGILSFLGFHMIAGYFLTVPIVVDTAREVQNFSAIISTVALGFGPFAILRQHIPRGRKGNIFSIVLLAGLIGMPVLYLITGSTVSLPYDWTYRSTVAALDTAIYSLVAYSIIAGCFRAFRVRNIDSLLVMGAAVVLLLGKVPIGGAFGPLSDWLMATPNTAGYRGVQLGVGLGLFAYSLRILLGVERTWLAEVGES
mgnify:CR=1 FL=1